MLDVTHRQAAPSPITLAPLLIVAILMVSALTGLTRLIEVGAVSALGAFTLVAVVLALLLWLGAPIVPRSAILPLGWILLFLLWVGTEALMVPPNVLGIQNAVVIVGFFALTLLTAREAHRSPRFVRTIFPKAVRVALWIALISYLAMVPRYGFDAKELISARGFATFAVMGLAWILPEARSGKRGSRVLALVTILLVAVSLSRLATAAALVMVAVAQLDWSSAKSKLRFFAGIILACALAFYSITSVAPVRDRFFQGDVSLRIGGLAINGEGRTRMWTLTLASARSSLLLGNGAGSSATLIQSFSELDHPHNDYLRVLHDYGLIGLSIWLLVLLVLLLTLLKRWRAASRGSERQWAHVHQAAFLGMLGFIILMTADNALAYPFVMLPLGMFVGCSLGTPAR